MVNDLNVELVVIVIEILVGKYSSWEFFEELCFLLEEEKIVEVKVKV